MSLLALNLDVLDLVLAHVRPYEALQLTRAMTCRAAHGVAMPRALSEVFITAHWGLVDPSPVRSFCKFMLADPGRRPPLLKAFTFEESAFHCTSSAGWPWEPHECEDASSLAHVIQLATRLRSINLHLSSHLFTANAALADAVAGLHNLDIIRFDDADAVTLNVLSRMKSRPRYVDVEILEYRYNNKDIVPCLGPFIRGRHHFLENFTESLIELKLSGYPDIVATLEPDTVWSCVKHLHLCGEINSLLTIARAFPRVGILELDGFIRGAVAPNQWSDLHFVRTRQPLQLSCPIRRLELEDYLSPISRMGTGDLRDPITVRLLQDASPVVLNCYLRGAISHTVLLSLTSLRFLHIWGDDSLDTADDIEPWIVGHV